MGVTLFWQPVTGKALHVGARSELKRILLGEALDKTFTNDNQDYLRGIADASEDFRGAVEELMDAIQQHDRVRVWAEY